MGVKRCLSFILALLLLGCAGFHNPDLYFSGLTTHLQQGNFSQALEQVEQGRTQQFYSKKDRVLYYLDKGAVLYYAGEYEQSNVALQAAENAMEELFTKSISNAAASLLLNDNMLAYSGEVYENFYVNIFKALNYLNMKKFDDAYVEIRRVNVKLRELSDKYEEMVQKMNASKDADIPIRAQSLNFHNNALAHYISYLIFRAEKEWDNCRISLNNVKSAVQTHSDIYQNSLPDFILEDMKTFSREGNYAIRPDRLHRLTMLSFVGSSPKKREIGGKITTYDNAIGISELDIPITLPNIPFPGMKAGYHFKFAFPILQEGSSIVNRIDVMINGHRAGRLYLFEDLGKIAVHTFKTKRDIIYFKTLIRTVIKGLAAAEAKKKLREETKANELGGWLINTLVDAGVDATEHADLRCWRTMPQHCYIGEVKVKPGVYEVALEYFDVNNQLIASQNFGSVKTDPNINILDSVFLY